MRNCRLIRFFFIFLFLSSHSAFSQFYHLRNYNVKDGLPGSDVYAMLQDASGYLWFTGDMGVSRFDGYGFKNYSTENGLPNNTIIDIREDHKGRIWFMSFSNTLSFYQDGKICQLSCNSKLEKLIGRGSRYTSLYIDHADTIWIGCLYSGIIKIAPEWKEEDVQVIDVEKDGGYIYKIDSVGFVHGFYNRKSDALRMTMYYKNKKENMVCHDIYSGSTYQRPYRNRMIRLRDGTFMASVNDIIFHFDDKGLISKKKEDNVVLSIMEDDDRVLIGTYNGLLMYSDKKFKNRTHIARLENKSIAAIGKDHENGLWFCTDGQGVYHIPHRNFRYYTLDDGLAESKITCVINEKEKIILGHLNYSISILDKQLIRHIRLGHNERSSLKLNVVSSLLFDKNEKMMASASHKVYHIDAGKSIVKEIYRDSKAGNETKKMIRSNDGNIWVVRYTHIAKCDPEFNVIKKITFHVYADNLFEDSNGKLWICALNGLWAYDDTSGLLYVGNHHPLLSKRIVDIKETPNGSLWMASRGSGIIVKKNNTYIHITEKDGLSGNMCKTLYCDTGNVLWVGTNKGLSKIEIQGNNKFKVSRFSSADGMLSNEVNHIIRIKNRLALIHNNGVSIIDPQELISHALSPPVYITQILVNGDTVEKSSLNHLKYDQNYFTISYAGLSYKAPGKIEYKYRMEGIDSNWNYTTNTSVNYQSLPPGTYRFVIYAKNHGGSWTQKPAVVFFTIEAAWWQTTLFKIASGVLVLIFVIIIFRIRLKKIQRREQEKSFIQSRIEASELKALRAQMNPHFVFNVINSVQYFITGNDPASSQKYLSKFGKLIRYVLDNSKPASIPLEKELEALHLYLELESLRFENCFDYSIDIRDQIDPAQTEVPSMLIQPYVENAIRHGIMHKAGRGKIRIIIERDDNMIKCTIEDNGIGRERSTAMKEEQNFEHKSVGMSITKERLDLINHISNSNLNVSVIDLTDDKGDAAGTKIQLVIPSN
jgi:ligand-binding sensor domain-containing protein